jgi:hypothetical protein
MPIISVFLGIVIRIYFSDHNPPHFHAEYGSNEALIEIKSGRVVHGKLPKRVLALIEEWRKIHVAELLKAWTAAQSLKTPKRIRPLGDE